MLNKICFFFFFILPFFKFSFIKNGTIIKTPLIFIYLFIFTNENFDIYKMRKCIPTQMSKAYLQQDGI